MIHEQCMNCKHCAWCAMIKGKWLTECMRPNYWGIIDEDNKECENYQFCSWENDE